MDNVQRCSRKVKFIWIMFLIFFVVDSSLLFLLWSERVKRCLPLPHWQVTPFLTALSFHYHLSGLSLSWHPASLFSELCFSCQFSQWSSCFYLSVSNGWKTKQPAHSVAVNKQFELCLLTRPVEKLKNVYRTLMLTLEGFACAFKLFNNIVSDMCHQNNECFVNAEKQSCV